MSGSSEYLKSKGPPQPKGGNSIKRYGMILKCNFSFPFGKKQELKALINILPTLSGSGAQKSSIITHTDKVGRISITVLYEFEGSRVMEVFREIFGKRDVFAGIPGFMFSAEFCRDDQSLINVPQSKLDLLSRSPVS